MTDNIDHPKHYNAHPSGVEAITVCEHMGFNLGNAMKYIWRADHKGASVEDLKKARWYVDREIQKREKEAEQERQAQLAAAASFNQPPQYRIERIDQPKKATKVRKISRNKARGV